MSNGQTPPPPVAVRLVPMPADRRYASDFWSGARDSARWSVTLRTGQELDCSVQARSFLRSLKRAVNRRATNQADAGVWTGTWSTALRAALATARVDASTRSAVADGQTRWTPEMLRLAIWYAYYQRTATPDAIVLPPNTVLPQTGAQPPDDGLGYVFPSPNCRPVSAPAPVVTPPTSQGGATLPAALDFTTGNFWSADPWGARWTIRLPDGAVIQCATSTKMLLRMVKSRLSTGFDPNDTGRWTAEWSDRLFRAVAAERRTPATSSSPLSSLYAAASTPSPRFDTQSYWTPDMLRLAIWYAFHRESAPEAVFLPAGVTRDHTLLPRLNADPPDDGRGTSLIDPSCRVATQGSRPATAPGSPTAPGTASVPATGVVLWGASWCPACQSLRQHLTRVGVQFTYRDWDTSSQADLAALAARIRRAGLVPGSIPVLEVGSRIQQGYDAASVDRLLTAERVPVGVTSASGSSGWIIVGAVAVIGVGALLVWYGTRPHGRTRS